MNAKSGGSVLGRVGRWSVPIAALTVAVLAGCTNAQLVDEWKDPSWRDQPMRSMLIVSRADDPTRRRLVEDAIAAQLEKQSIDAVPSYQVFPDGVPSQSALEETIGQKDLDGAIVLKPLAATTETHWVPGYTTTSPREFYNPWTGRGGVVWRERQHRGYHEIDRYARQQVTVWSGGEDGRMVWAGTVEVANPSSGDDLRLDLAKGLVPEMKQAGII